MAAPQSAPDNVAARARPSSAKPRFPSKPWRRAAAGLLALALLLLGAGGALWAWAGSEGSLATVLRWAGARVPLGAEQVSGSLRAGGRAGRLTWDDNGLRVEVEQAELRWTPAALLRRTLHLRTLAAARITITGHGPDSEPSAGPPASLALPLRIRVDALRVGELRWAGPPAQVLTDIAARYDYDGARHRFQLDQAQFDAGRYRAQATLAAQAPLTLDLALDGTLAAPVPSADAPLPLTLRATLRGPLADLAAQAEVQADAHASADAPRLQASARLAPWAAQPLPEAHATVRDFDAGALWHQAPRTRLSGRVDLAPLAAAGWAITADLANADSGPWDRQRLPLQSLQADLRWQDGAATVRTLGAQLAGGTLRAEGRWAPAADAPWRIDAHASGIDPARLHTQLAALPLDGSARVQGTGAAIDFDLALQARAAAPSGDALTRQWQALRLQAASARGQWAGGLLTLRQLQLRTDAAEIAGSAQLHLAAAAPGGSADLRLRAPGLTAAVQGELQPTRGGGTLRAQASDGARLLAWARTLPGAGAALAGWQARGSAELQARWSGGWRDPGVQLRLATPGLALTLPAGAAEAPPVQLQDTLVTLDGRLAQARLAVRAALRQGPRALDLRLAAQGGRGTAPGPLAAARWQAQVTELQASVRDPLLGDGAWQLASRAPFTLEAGPQAGGTLALGAGELAITSPAPSAQARIAWGPLRRTGGELGSTGRISGLPLQWAERLGGFALADAGIEGSLTFDGSWDVQWGRQPRLRAELARAEGDLTLVARDEATGVASRVDAGLRQARLSLASDGPAVTLSAQWDSAEAGSIDARLASTLSATPAADGGTRWRWAEDAPLNGTLSARLLRIATWSVLAPPGWRLRGRLAADVRIAGTRAAPQLSGTLGADDLALRSVVDGLQLGRGRLRARLDGTRLLIDELSLRGPGQGDTGGRLVASGEAGWSGGQAGARLALTLERLRASVRSDRQVTVSGQVQAALAGRAVTVEGGLRVDTARIVLPEDSAPALGDDVVVRDGRTAQARTQTQAAGEPAGAQPLTIDARVQVDLGDDLRVSGMGMDTRLAGRLTLTARGPLATPPRVEGSIHAVDGSFHAYGQNLVIARGGITFTGAPDNPQLDIVALRPNYGSDQKAGVQVAGTALLPRVRLYSEPQLSDTQTLAWLLLGRPAPDTGAEAAMLQSAALALLGGRDSRGIASRLGLDELSFANGQDGSVAGASITLGKRLSERLYAAYEHSLAGTTGSLLIFYELSRRWSLRGQAGENAAVDLIYRISFD